MKSYNEVAAEATVKEIFDGLRTRTRGNKISGFEIEHHPVAEIILATVRDFVAGFQADIANRALKGQRLSEKQRWVIAFAFDKVREKINVKA